MGQYVLQFGTGAFGSLKEVLSRELKGIQLAIEVLPDKTAESMHYQKGPEALSDAFEMVEAGAAVSIIARPLNGPLRYALVLPPYFNGQQLSLWSGTLEWGDIRWQETWERLLQRMDLRFVTVGFEEGVDLLDSSLSEERFPWAGPPTLIAALRTGPNREWIVKSNPGHTQGAHDDTGR